MVILFTADNLQRVKQAFPKKILVSSMCILKAIHDDEYELFYHILEDQAMQYLVQFKMVNTTEDNVFGFELTPLGLLTVKLFNQELNEDTLVIENVGVQPAVSKGYKNAREAVADVDNWISEWNELWPEGIRQSGKLVKSDIVTSSTRMKKWLGKYWKYYTADIILKATKLYIEIMRKDDYRVIRRSYYFITKTEEGGTFSDLATYCDMVTKDKGTSSEGGLRTTIN